MSGFISDDEIRAKAKTADVAYRTISDFYNSDDASATNMLFNKNFVVSPCVPMEAYYKGEQTLEQVIRNGMIVQVPNLPEELLSPIVKDARENVVKMGIKAAAEAILPTKVRTEASRKEVSSVQSHG